MHLSKIVLHNRKAETVVNHLKLDTFLPKINPVS